MEISLDTERLREYDNIKKDDVLVKLLLLVIISVNDDLELSDNELNYINDLRDDFFE